MRVRKQLITNLYVKDKDIKRLANGYVVYKRANKHAHAIIPKQKVDDRRKAEVLKAKVDYHKAQIVKLIGSSKELKDFAVAELSKPKHKYVKKNLEYWAKGGNIATVWNSKKEAVSANN